jgi:hypothetical protein
MPSNESLTGSNQMPSPILYCLYTQILFKSDFWDFMCQINKTVDVEKDMESSKEELNVCPGLGIGRLIDCRLNHIVRPPFLMLINLI